MQSRSNKTSPETQVWPQRLISDFTLLKRDYMNHSFRMNNNGGNVGD